MSKFNFKSRIPRYNDDSDYTTNAPSYYDALARFNESLKILTERMNDVEQHFKDLILEWLEDGTLAGLLEQVLLDDYATKEYVQQAINDLNIDQYAKKEWVNQVLNEYIDLVNQLVDDVNLRMDQLETDVDQLIKDINLILEEHKNDIINHVESLEVKSDGGLYQTLLGELYTGMNGTEIFTGASNSPQGITYVHHDGIDKVFMLTRTRGSSWGGNEYSRITEYHLKEDGSVINHVQFSQEIQVGHQGISAFIEDGQLYFITGATTGNSPNTTKGFSKVKWNGSATNQGDVTSYKVLGDDGSGHNLEAFYNATPCISPDGKYIIMAVSQTYDTNTRYIIIFDRKQVENSTDPLCEPPLNLFRIESPSQVDGHVTQDLACDGERIYIFSGYTKYPSINAINIYTLNGRHLGHFSVEGAYADYTLDQLKKGDNLLGTPKYFEAEGITIRGNELLILTTDVWEKNGSYTKKTQKLHAITTEKNARSKPINRGFISIESPASLHLRGTTRDLSIPKGDAFQISFWDEFTREFTDMMVYADESALRLYDGRDGSDHKKYSMISNHFDEGNQYVVFRSDRSNSYGSGFNAHTNDSDTSGRFSIHFGNPQDRLYLDSGEIFLDSDGVVRLGTPNHRFSEVYASDGAIKTSDRNHKQDIEDIPDQVLNAWSEVKYFQYRMKESVNKKGDEARKHIGLIAQDIIKAFENHGLNAFEYGIVGYDEWEYKPEKVVDDEVVQSEEKAGSIYSIRADECLFLESALMRRELNKIKDLIK